MEQILWRAPDRRIGETALAMELAGRGAIGNRSSVW